MSDTICEWITLKAPSDIHTLGNELSQAWLAVLRALWSREQSAGFRDCHWSRVQEDRMKLYIWTSWQNRAAYDLQKDNERSQNLYSKLRTLSKDSVTISLIQFEQFRSYAFAPIHRHWPSITVLHFEKTLSQTQRDHLQELKCINAYEGFGAQDNPDRLSARGFVVDARNGMPSSSTSSHTTYVFLDYWTSPAREEAIRARKTWFADSIEALGCARITTEHLRFSFLFDPEKGHAESIRERGFEYDWAKGRREEDRKARTLHGKKWGGKRKRWLRGTDMRINPY